MDLTGYKTYLFSTGKDKRTVKNYTNAISCFDGKNFSLTTVQKFISLKLETLSPSGVNHYIKAVKAYCKYKNLKWGEKLKKVKEKIPIYQLLDANELEKVISFGDEKYDLILTLLTFTGARISEILNLKVDDLYDGFAILNHTKTDPREIAIPEATYKRVQEYIKTINSNYLFGGMNNSPISDTMVRKVFKKRLKALGIRKKTRIHDLRHAWGTVNARVSDLRTVQKQMGHKSLVTTQRYLHPTRDDQTRVVNNDPRLLDEMTKDKALKNAIEEISKIKAKYKEKLDIEFSESGDSVTLRISID